MNFMMIPGKRGQRSSWINMKIRNHFMTFPGRNDKVIDMVTEWFGDDYGLAVIDGKFWMVAVGSTEEGGNKWWFKMRLKTDDIETARKVILLDKCRPRRY